MDNSKHDSFVLNFNEYEQYYRICSKDALVDFKKINQTAHGISDEPPSTFKTGWKRHRPKIVLNVEQTSIGTFPMMTLMFGAWMHGITLTLDKIWILGMITLHHFYPLKVYLLKPTNTYPYSIKTNTTQILYTLLLID